ncbi:MAG: glycine zipper domain-containing protein [Caldimonas sp.]
MQAASTLPIQRAFRRKLFVRVLALATLLGGLAAMPTWAVASSNRCPADKLDAGKDATAAEIGKIEGLWKDLHGPGATGGDGPLGCPIGTPVVVADKDIIWTGLLQSFQRGAILVGRGASAGGDALFVRGLGEWAIWFTGMPAIVLPTLVGTGTTQVRPAAWARGGSVFFADIPDPDRSVSLLKCPSNQAFSQSSISINGCKRLLPELYAPDRPFDPAARLEDKLLTLPDVASKGKRVDAILADWLPCHTRPAGGGEVGEAAFSHVMIMLRREATCPLSGKSPRSEAIRYLSTVTFPADMVPGTSYDGAFPCSERVGELDVTLAQVLRVMLDYRDVLGAPVIDHLKSIVATWGRTVRPIPYVMPGGSCGGFLILESENHILLQETASYLINGIRGFDTAPNRDWMLRFLGQIARRDFYEFNALPYSRYQLKALYLLHDHAPDAQVKTMARGLLNWLFTKQAVSGNLDRDHRPYRRLFSNGALVPRDWWGSSATPVTTAAAVLAGPLQHGHADIDLQYEKGLDDAGKVALTDPTLYPRLGTLPGYSTEALMDAISTGYVPPAALVGWLERRFTNEDSNRLTYLQAFNHVPKMKEDRALFAQENSGAELVSGNRNWTMIAGGTPAPPGDPGPPPSDTILDITYAASGAVVGAALGAYLGTAVGGPLGTAAGTLIGGIIGGLFGGLKPADIALDKQTKSLWETQAATIRETILIPTPGGLDRSQTMRFGRSVVTTGDPQVSRLCVGDGLMCGFDLKLPPRLFPTNGALSCPDLGVKIPASLTNAFQARVGPGSSMTSVLGCPIKAAGYQKDGNWDVWTFENGMLALGHDDTAGSERFAGAWVEGREPTKRGNVRIAWDIRGDGYDWFRVHAYERPVLATGGEPPGGWIEPLPVVGNASDRTKDSVGDTSMPISPGNDLEPESAASTWDVLIVGCTKKYFLGVLRGHNCVDNKMPRLSVDVAPLPNQPFACAVHAPPPPQLLLKSPPHEGIVLEVGSCKGGPYGLFVYYWSKACPAAPPPSVFRPSGFECRDGASDYGFVVAAPSRGMKPDEFRNIIEASMRAWRAGGEDYRPDRGASIDVPMSPPTVLGPSGNWMPTAVPTKHTVSFRWPVVDGVSILADSSVPAMFTLSTLGAKPKSWPTALGYVLAPDAAVASASLTTGGGDGCYTVAGLPTPTDRDPMGLLIDLRDVNVPVVEDRRNSVLSTLCH